MYSDAVEFGKSCPECAFATGVGRRHNPPLHPIPVQRPFQILGVDIMDLPRTEQGNKHVIVFQDFFTKWPFVFAIPDQKTERIAKLLAQEIIPFFGVPEALLSDRGTNLLSHLVLDLCDMFGIKKLNTTSYHPQCDGMVERFNRTLKIMLRKHAARFGNQWDKYLSGILWSYRNTRHSSTREKPSFLLFGLDGRSPTEAAFMPVARLQPTDVADYREKLMLTLSSARELASKCIERAQRRYKNQHDRKATQTQYKIGEWVLVRFPHEQTGRLRKLSRPWHGLYRVVSRRDPDITVTKVYFPEEDPIQVHLNRVCPCPLAFPAGYFWYGGRRKGPGRPPKWVDQLLSDQLSATAPEPAVDSDADDDRSEADDSSGADSSGIEETSDEESEPENTPDRLRVRTETGRFRLREKVSPPQRYM